MSGLIANINGKKVYSDKIVDSIVNARITFTDGSWCDAVIGQIVNKGPGYINIDSPEESANEKPTDDVGIIIVNPASDEDVVIVSEKGFENGTRLSQQIAVEKSSGVTIIQRGSSR